MEVEASASTNVVSYFTHLECSVPCGAPPRDPHESHHLCSCGMPLVARYDLPAAARSWRRESLIGREPNMWRYRELMPLADGDKPAALVDYARRRGFTLADEVIRYLLVHGRRDMTALCATLAALDRHSLATKRPITVPLLRDWLQREMTLGR